MNGIDPEPNKGTGTLRQTIVDANSKAGHDTIVFSDIVFDQQRTIILEALLPTITEDVTIIGTFKDYCIISGDEAYRIFTIDSANVDISHVTILDGKATVGGGISMTASGTSKADHVHLAMTMKQSNKCHSFAS